MKFTFNFNLVLIGALGASLVAPALAAEAEAEAGRTPRPVTGIVVDPTGGALPGASVSVRRGLYERKALADGQGRFRFDGVPAGPSSLTVTLDHFQPALTEVAASRRPVRIMLEPSGVIERVTVSESGPFVRRTLTATRTDSLLRDVPQSITVIPRAIIDELGMRNMGDLVRYVPGIGMAQGEGNRDTPVFRGNSSTSDFLVDGIRDDVQYFRDLYNVSGVEALKGPDGMIFGRAGVGGVINRVTKQADWSSPRELAVQGGSFTNRRLTTDLGAPLNDSLALRATGLYENSGSYRSGVDLERYGFNPSVAFRLSAATTLTLAYERFHDGRTADRGIPSFRGAPVASDPATFFGNPDSSESTATVDAGTAFLSAELPGGVALRNRTRLAGYDKFYQNVFPGAVTADGQSVAITAYNNATDRTNLFNQTDLNWRTSTGSVGHTLLTGVEVGRQVTDNLRNTGYFTSIGPSTTSVLVPLAQPTTDLPISFRPSATDPDNHGVVTTIGVYVQDQVALTDRIQAILGLRYDDFDVDLRNNRTGLTLSSHDTLLSPRAGLIFKPAEPLSIYAAYTIAHQPRAGEQLASLTPTNRSLDPEKFKNYEVGAKWEVAPVLSVTAAAYRLERTNVAVPDPVDPLRLILVDGQRTDGLELGISGTPSRGWTIVGAYAYQDGEILHALSETVGPGARLAQLPSHSFSLWNRADFLDRWGAGLGLIHQTSMFTSTDNTVTLPGYTRVDGAVYCRLSSRLRAQVNFENLLDERYFLSAHNNNNITPGSPRVVRASLAVDF